MGLNYTLDLAHLAVSRGSSYAPAGKQTSLSCLGEATVGLSLSGKQSNARTSDWTVPTLTPMQIEYAACDVLMGVLIFEFLNSKLDVSHRLTEDGLRLALRENLLVDVMTSTGNKCVATAKVAALTGHLTDPSDYDGRLQCTSTRVILSLERILVPGAKLLVRKRTSKKKLMSDLQPRSRFIWKRDCVRTHLSLSDTHPQRTPTLRRRRGLRSPSQKYV